MRIRVLSALLLVLMAVAPVACGGGDDDDAAPSPASENRTAEVPQPQRKQQGDAIMALIDGLNQAFVEHPIAGLSFVVENSYPVWSGSSTVQDCLGHFSATIGYLAGAQVNLAMDRSALRPIEARSVSGIEGIPEGQMWTGEGTATVANPAAGTTSPPVTARQIFTVVPDGTAKFLTACA